jgi:hypothetical protein
MAVTETTTLTHTSLTFETVDELADAFVAENPSADLDAAIAFVNASVASGDLIQTASLNADKSGLTFNRTWTDAKWAEGSSMNYPTTIEGWRVDSTNDA